jgi:hypothetical protein
MQKSLIFLSIITAFFLSAAALAQGQCTRQFSITSPGSVDMAKTVVWVEIQVANTGSCEGSAMVYPVLPEGWYYGGNFTTGTLQPGESENSSIKIFTSQESSAVIRFLAEGAAAAETKMIIGGMEPGEAPTQETAPQEEAKPPLITPAPTITPISFPREAQPAESAPAESQTEAVPSTGLLTSNPAAQIAVFALLLLGAGYLLATIRSEGFRYRFRRK